MADISENIPAVPQTSPLELTVIVPARNEQDALPACLESLLAQSEPGFELGRHWELIVVDDHSTDETPRIIAQAAQTPGVIALPAPTLEPGRNSGFTGKTSACWAGAQIARGRLFVFTDADTIHEPGDLSRARHELEKYKVALLSYSPRQLVSTFWQRALMPLVFAELATTYPMAKVNDPDNRIAAANGQFLMVEQEAYFSVGGHRAVGPDVLEDVALARNIKRAKHPLRFRYAPDALATRMYRTNAAMVEGWTKNLALLFSNALVMAAMRSLELLLIVGIPTIALVYPFFISWQRAALFVVWFRGLWAFYRRTSRSNFPITDCAIAILGLPLLIVLLLRSYMQVKITKSVEWKGRTYPTDTH
ncbi:glycosyltransferase [Granulicella tundricola]|uniref:Glycosyl transferase family 2 n=1 Tax=Granulicella tundricola (strain ATCC BAA-1859 / DSM 23138 / MP5ACTX9) TaxID=1198114 RepID=E8X3Q2_GRATM|nr:glycosyltransferase family 2 protein [Granulicella tundricola]ADW69330.1 glycosyl transferase family 2 [Granulicella tundricola MP5ACTX9]